MQQTIGMFRRRRVLLGGLRGIPVRPVPIRVLRGIRTVREVRIFARHDDSRGRRVSRCVLLPLKDRAQPPPYQ